MSTVEDVLWSAVTSRTGRHGDVSVFWELLANIHKLQLSVSVGADEPAQLLLADASTVRCAVVTGLPAGQLSAAGSSRGHLVGVAVHTLPLPCASTLPVGPLAWQQSSDGPRQLLDARIDVEPSDDAAERALTARYAAILDSELHAVGALTALFCGWCGQRLAGGDAAAAALVRKALAMPSDHWVELADLWVCHKETFTQFAKQPLQPSVEHALLSAVALHFHSSLFNSGVVVLDSDSASLLCGRCRARLGHRPAGQHALQLYKHAVSTRPRPGDDGNLFAGYTLPMLYAAQLYSACLARLVYFFSLTVDDGTPVLHVRVLSTALVSLSPHRHLKLLYQRPSLAAADPKSPFATPRSHESVRCPLDDAVQLLDALVRSSQQLPQPRRHVAGWSLGFLPLPYLFRS